MGQLYKVLISYKQLQIQHMLRNLFDTIASKISNLNPIKQFIKYALDKTLNEFLKKELTLQDFKNGPLNLQNIQINTEKINKSYLVSSPYIMHSGIIGNLKITLPPLSELSTQSIQISVSQVQVTLKPNKKFSENFKQKMLQLHQMQKYDVEQKQIEGEISQTGPVDFFKQLLKKIIMNIKVNISNIAVKLYMNTPSEDKSSTQFYLMLRVPLIYLDKKQDKQIKKNQTQQISFNILLPQISVHLLSQDIKFPQYKNLKGSQQDFPLKYPTVNHPKTILLIGSSNLPENIVSRLAQWKKDGSINNMNFTQMGFKLTTDYKKKTKQINLHLKIANVESMLNPIQIKILSRFVAQIIEFKKILQSVINELKAEASDSICLNKKKSKNQFHKSGNNDLFSSIMMSLSNDMGNSQFHSRQSGGMFKSMIKEDKIFRESVRQYNLQFQKQMKAIGQGSDSMTVQFQAIQFKQSLRIDFEFTSLSLYVLKYSTNQDYLRLWRNDTELNEQLINKNIPCDYFMFTVRKIDVKIKAKQKITSVNIKSLKLYNIKLNQPKQQSSAESFYDIGDSIDFQSSKVANRSSMHLNEIKQFVISKNSHYCVEEIVAISQNESEGKVEEQNAKKYSLMPQLHHSNEDAYILYKPAVSIHLDNIQKYFKINFQVVSVAVNLQLVLDFLNIAFPMLAYKRLADIINFKRSEVITMNSQIYAQKKESRKNIFQSMYEYRVDLQPLQQIKSQNKNTLIIQIAQAKIGFRKGEVCNKNQKGELNSNFSDLVRKQKQKIYEEQSFSKVCFCNVNETGIYLQLQGLKMQKKLSGIKVYCKIIDIGIMTIKKSQITGLSSILSIKSIRPEDSIRVLKQTTHCESLIIVVPELNARFTEDDIVNIASLSVDSIKIISNIVRYYDYLNNQMMLLQKKSAEFTRKNRKNEANLEKQIKVYVQKIFIQLDYCSFLIQQIYLAINQQSEQNIVCKISKIIGGVNRQNKDGSLKVKMCDFHNDQIITRQYPSAFYSRSSDKLIAESDVFIEMWDRQKPNFVFKVQQRHTFFDKLQKQNFSLIFKLIKKQTERSQSNYMKKQSGEGKSKLKWNNSNNSNNNSLSQKFKFKQFNPAIEQQGQKKIMIVNISKDVKIYICNALELKRHVQKIQKFTNYLKSKMKQAEEKLKSQAIMLIQRKHSAQIENQLIQFILKSSSTFIVDIRPDFIRNANQRIFSNTRSILTLNLHSDLVFQINKDKNQKEIVGLFSLGYYFLKHTDNQIALNPLVLREQKHFSELGFKSIIQINKISLKMNIYETNKTLNLSIKSIFGQASLETLSWIQIHFEHFVNHHIKQQIGVSVSEIYDGEDFCVLEYDAETDPDLDNVSDIVVVGAQIQQQLEIQDLTGALQLYQQKLNTKNSQQASLRARTLTFEPFKNPTISISCFSLQKVCFRISHANDFCFSKPNGNQKRTRIKQPEQMEFYVIMMNNLYFIADVASQKIQEQSQPKNFMLVSLFLKLQKLKLNLSKQKNFGHSHLKYLDQLNFHDNFIILNSQNQICLVFQKKPEKILIKTYCLKLNIGGTTQLLSTFKKLKAINLGIQRSGWKKIYENKQVKPQIEKSVHQSKIIKKDAKIQPQRLLIMLPESSIKLTFQYANLLKIVDEQTIQIKQLVLNEQIKDKFQIGQKIKRWLKKLVKNNLGSIISGTALNLLIKLFSQLIALNIRWLSKLLGFFFNSSQ